MKVHSSTLNSTRKPVSFPEIGQAYMTMMWELHAKVKALILSNLLFSFQGLTEERIPQFLSIIKVWLYNSLSLLPKKIIQPALNKYRHVIEDFFKKWKTKYSGSPEAPPWWVSHWVKFWIFSYLECWKQHFWDKITKNFYSKEGVIRSSITSY